MADEENSTPSDVSEETGSATDAGQQEDVTANLSDAGKRALTEERKARAAAERQAKAAQKQLDDLSKKLQAFEDRDKTEAQKLAEAKTAAEREAASAKQELMRYRVAASKKLPANLAARLQGDTEEEMAADADLLLEVLGTHQQASMPSYDGGVRKTAAAPTDMNALIRRAAGH
ncbi:putative nucleic acid-binding Zn-ribbon protein [Streptomyces glaucescens]